jgi:hypothetical protein
MKGWLKKFLNGELDHLQIPMPPRPLSLPKSIPVNSVNSVQSENGIRNTLTRPTIFAGTTTKWDFADVLTAEQKETLLFMERHGEKEHLHQAAHAIAAYEATGDVAQLRGAIAVLIHLLDTQH